MYNPLVPIGNFFSKSGAFLALVFFVTLSGAYHFFALLLQNLAEQRKLAGKELRRGSVLDPYRHPSYSVERAAAVQKAAKTRDATIKGAHARFANIVNQS